MGFGVCQQARSHDLFPSTKWFAIMTVWATTLILSSSIEYLSAHMYNSSMVVGRSKDSD